ncbi:GNAT family N-acetyltransferase [Streptomyces sp. ASQP_92]|uniref:GNAT family N-acetyltransferase n=1 Tax=Streptomyces sp. ASQP_92 TaxID=2979116 RepID=UPI0021BF0CD7|nr:GNAT family N-acetyltransferase [Streptomyces sp. ASQP_92]MCT9088894.1 GNAT family N-acetyltransferase [Streptomyces sp. ASQP_92]
MWTCEQVVGASLDVAEVLDLYRASTLAERRPVGDTERFTKMLAGANLVVTARLDGRLIGIARSVTDGSYVTYLSDIAVDVAFQRRGVGRDLIRATQEAAPRAKVVLLSAPAAVDYYPHIGFKRHESAWTLDALG